MSHRATLDFEKIKEKGQRRSLIQIFTQILEDFYICPTHGMKLWRSNHQMFKNFYFETIERKSKTRDWEKHLYKGKAQSPYSL